MSVQQANAVWQGTLKSGQGVMSYGDVEGPFTFASRFEDGDANDPPGPGRLLRLFVSLGVGQGNRPRTKRRNRPKGQLRRALATSKATSVFVLLTFFSTNIYLLIFQALLEYWPRPFAVEEESDVDAVSLQSLISTL